MKRLLIAVVLLPLISASSTSQPPQARPRPKLEAVAETKLLMDGLLLANFRGLERHLKQQPPDDTTWMYARGQSLLIAETGNLLMMRPPRSAGQETWQDFAVELRERGTRLARAAAAKDLERSRTDLGALARTCNGCHQSFGQPLRVAAFAEPAP